MSDSAAAPTLRRDPDGGVIAGVAAGIARRVGIDPLIVRVGFIATSLMGANNADPRVADPIVLAAWLPAMVSILAIPAERQRPPENGHAVP